MQMNSWLKDNKSRFAHDKHPSKTTTLPLRVWLTQTVTFSSLWIFSLNKRPEMWHLIFWAISFSAPASAGTFQAVTCWCLSHIIGLRKRLMMFKPRKKMYTILHLDFHRRPSESEGALKQFRQYSKQGFCEMTSCAVQRLHVIYVRSTTPRSCGFITGPVCLATD